ncbi:MAG: 50S ribosomal protein L5 [Thermodesulfobacteriota bacterium]
MARVAEIYRQEIIPSIMKEFQYGNVMRAPKMDKIVINVGLGSAVQDAKVIDHAVRDLTALAGQKPVVTRAKKSIASFKLRAGVPIGCMVTLRGRRMYEFFDRLINFSLPRIRDFRGLSPKSFDGRGNYTLGLREQIIFPEIEYDKVDKVRGMNITITTTAKSDKEARVLLKELGVPFRES